MGFVQHSASGSPRTLRASVIVRLLCVLISRRAALGALGDPGFYRVPDLWRDLHPVEPRDLLDAGRRGDVDLGQPVADHIDADKDQPLGTQGRPDRRADLAVAGAQRGSLGAGSDMEVGARLTLRGHPHDGTHGFAFDEDDALVTLPDLGDVALYHHRLA